MTNRHVAAILLGALLSPVAAGAEPTPIIASEKFHMYCNQGGACGPEAGPDIPERALVAMQAMERAQAWLKKHGFLVAESHLESLPEREILRISPGNRCGSKATACHQAMTPKGSRIYLPLDNLDDIERDTSTLAHEYLHALQPNRDPGVAKWLHEAVPTAVGTMFGVVDSGLGMGIYPPAYLMSLDRPLYDAVDKGYGNWAYLLAVGKLLNSPDRIAYLSAPGFLKAAEIYKAAKSPAAPMAALYDSSLVGAQTFDKAFPKFVASFNNLEPSVAPGESAYHYYTDIERETLRVASTDMPASETFEFSVPTYAAAPILMELDVTPEPEADPKDTLMMAEIEVVTGSPIADLTLVTEHKLAGRQHLESVMIDGSAAPDELGFLRVVNAPAQQAGPARDNAFQLRVRARPIGLGMPACFQAGTPVSLEAQGFDPEEADNWQLETDNGSADGLTVTPARAGAMELTLRIESPITRAETGIARRAPETSKVSLGRFEVVGEDCMVRLSMGEAVLTYTGQGEYTEFSAPTGEAIYFSASDFAAFRGGWMPIPPMAKQMMLSRMTSRMPMMQLVEPDGGAAEGPFLARMPYAFSRRFSWANLRTAIGPDGERVARRRAACPNGGSGCSKVTVGMEGHPVPVLFDAQGRPIEVELKGQKMRFDYGSWPIRRPPGW